MGRKDRNYRSNRSRRLRRQMGAAGVLKRLSLNPCPMKPRQPSQGPRRSCSAPPADFGCANMGVSRETVMMRGQHDASPPP